MAASTDHSTFSDAKVNWNGNASPFITIIFITIKANAGQVERVNTFTLRIIVNSISRLGTNKRLNN